MDVQHFGIEVLYVVNGVIYLLLRTRKSIGWLRRLRTFWLALASLQVNLTYFGKELFQ